MRLFTLSLVLLIFVSMGFYAEGVGVNVLASSLAGADSEMEKAQSKLEELRKNKNFFKTGILWPNDQDRAGDWSALWREPVMAHVGHAEEGPEIQKINAALSPLYALYGCRPDQRLIATIAFSKDPGKPLLSSCGNYRGTVLFFERELIQFLSPEEIRGLVAHEFGHLLPDVNSLMGEAVKKNSLVECHVVEYLCDAVAYESGT